MNKKSVHLGPKEIQLIYTLEKQNLLIFNIADVKSILKTSDASVKNVVYRLKDKHRVIEIERGKYLLAPAKSGVEGYWSEHTFKILNKLIDTYYVSYWTALHHWGMTEQIPRTTYVVTTKIKKDIEFFGEKIQFVTVVPKKFYGYITGRNQINFDNLFTVAKKFNVSSVQRRLGYLLEKSGLLKEHEYKKLKENFKGFRWFDPSANKKILCYDRNWGLKVNISEESLFDWRIH